MSAAVATAGVVAANLLETDDLHAGETRATIADVPAVDVHGHFGQYVYEGTHSLKMRWMSGDPATVIARANAAKIRHTVVSPLEAFFPHSQCNIVAANETCRRAVEQNDALLQWVVVNPLQPATADQARGMLKHPRCMGIKIHPEEHGYPIAKHGRAIFELAAEFHAVVLTHSGEPNSLPADYVPLVNDFPTVTLILAHLGNSGAASNSPELQVRAIQAAKHGNLYTDTSSSQSLLPGLIEWAVREIGPDRILFGTDTPVYFSPSQRARINHADLADEQKRMILCDNARRILRIPSPDVDQHGATRTMSQNAGQLS
jgi:predicted TIM-barrel fold metal-dependent hydrolase